MKIAIRWSGGEILGGLNDTPGARLLYAALPFTAPASTWGEEVYFETPVNMALEDGATDVVEPGAICFWVQGHSLALPFGPTPASRGEECRLVTRVNVLGRIEGDPRALAGISDGDAIAVARVDEQ